MTDYPPYLNPLMDIQRFLEEVMAETPRAAAVVSAVQLSGQLGQLLQNAMVPEEAAQNALLGEGKDGDRPLASFSARIRAAYAFGLISKGVRDDLDLIRRIRNRFAHAHHGGLDFSNAEVVAWCGSLQIPGKIDASGIPEFQGARGRFTLAVGMLVSHIQSESVSSYGRCPSIPGEVDGTRFAFIGITPVRV
jgi:DNA-binding MltR family transcriptional regulator